MDVLIIAVVGLPAVAAAAALAPRLYSASASMPTINFRREFTAISGLSIVLVIVSAVILGLFFAWVLPGLGLWWGIALGAIVSPTNALATSVVKRVGVSGRVVSVLEGESLLNDATVLVLLRTAIAGTAVIGFAVVAAGALLLTLIVRAAYVAPLLASLRRRTRRGERSKPRLNVMQQRLDGADLSSAAPFGREDARGGH